MEVVDQAEALRKARQFADTAYSAEMGNAAREFSTKLQATQALFTKRGIAFSGSVTSETARLRGERATTLTKRLEFLLEGYESYGVEITDQIAAETLDDVITLRGTTSLLLRAEPEWESQNCREAPAQPLLRLCNNTLR